MVQRSSSPVAPASSARTCATQLVAAVTTSSASTTCRPAAATTSSTWSTTTGFTFIEADVCEDFPSKATSTRCCTSPARRARPSTCGCRSRRWTSSSIGTRRALDLARANGARSSSRRRARSTATRSCTRRPRSYWGNVNPVGPRAVYDEAKRFAEALTMAYHREFGVRHRDRADLQHLRPAPAPRRRPRGVELPRAGDDGRAAHGLRRRQPDPVVLLRGRRGPRPHRAASTPTRSARSTSGTRTSSRCWSWPRS